MIYSICTGILLTILDRCTNIDPSANPEKESDMRSNPQSPSSRARSEAVALDTRDVLPGVSRLSESMRVESLSRRTGSGGLSMHPAQRSLLWLNVIGGIAVLGSYVHGLASNPLTRGAVWGDVPDVLRPFYTINMLLAAAGYFAFSFYVFRRLDPVRTRIAGGFGFGAFHVLYALILLPSALWLPLTFEMLAAPSAGLWLAIRAVLALVGLGSLGLMLAIASAVPRSAPGARRIALVGTAFFSLQTAVLDALIWPAYFPV